MVGVFQPYEVTLDLETQLCMWWLVALISIFNLVLGNACLWISLPGKFLDLMGNLAYLEKSWILWESLDLVDLRI